MSSKMLYRSISSEKSISCDIISLWKVISLPSNLDLFHPFCRKNTIIRWSKENSIDQIEYLNGLIFQREFFEWEENKGYKLYIHQIGKPKSRVEWKIKGDNAKSIINISERRSGSEMPFTYPLIRYEDNNIDEEEFWEVIKKTKRIQLIGGETWLINLSLVA